MIKSYNCRICKKKGSVVIDLGYHPLANAILKRKNHKETKYPLKIFRCKSCYTLQLTRSINPKVLFDNYVCYFHFSIRIKKTFYSCKNTDLDPKNPDKSKNQLFFFRAL